MTAALILWALLGQPPAAPADPWAPLRFLVGEWEGDAQGEPGRGTARRSYSFVLADRYLFEKNTSVYPAQEKNPKGETHEHWSFLSYDRLRKSFVLRQFHQEGFVNQYLLVRREDQDRTLVFETERLENLPGELKARETYRVLSPDEFTETFEIAEPGKDFALYSRNHFRRVK